MSDELIPTPLHDRHEALGARLTSFAGWNMPLRYGSAVEEHQSVRNQAGLFDLSHMAEIAVIGPDAAAMLDYAFIGLISSLDIGQARYTMICNDAGGIVDDLVVYRRAEDGFLVVANASNGAVVTAELAARAEGFDAEVADESLDTALIAIQGPTAEAIVVELTNPEIADLRYYRGADAEAAGLDAFVARTGYTGEDGFELYVPADEAVGLWDAAMTVGEAHGMVPAGLAARDTLRLEAGMPLYGQELSLATTPFDVGSERMVKFDKPDFVGRAALEPLVEEPHRDLVGLVVEGRRPARQGYALLDGDTGVQVGELTSGTLSPTLDYPIAIASIEPGVTVTSVNVDVRGTITPARIVELPFYKRPRP